jgi:plasmid stabilization system protein ParE
MRGGWEAAGAAETIRQRLFDSYKILFATREDVVHVLHIRHQAEDLEDLTP